VAVRKSGDQWIVEFMFRGVRIFRRLPPGRSKGEAQALESKLRGEIFNSVDLGRAPDPPLRRIIEAWSHGKDKKQISHVNAVLSGLKPEDTLSQLSAVAERLKAGWDLAPGTINRRLSVLKASAKYAKRKRWADRNYSSEVELLREPRYTRREVNPDMARQLIKAASTPRAKALIAMAAFTGMRLSEVLRFNPDTDLEDGAARVLGKNGEERLIPLPAEMKPHLGQFPMTANWRNVYRGFIAARKRAGLTLRFHDLRHMAATAMAEAKHHPLVAPRRTSAPWPHTPQRP
jgi:integrase